MQINVTYDASAASAPAGFAAAVQAAVAYFETTFVNPITINITVGWGEVGGQALAHGSVGASQSPGFELSYAAFRQALAGAADSADVFTAVTTLPHDDPTGGGNVFVSSAEAKALGFYDPNATASDGAIGLDASTSFNFDASNRAQPGLVDAVGVLENQIAQVLGRVSFLGSDTPGQGLLVGPLDLFRYASPGQLNPVAANASFSIDGQTMLAPLENPAHGDPSDWASSVTGDAFSALPAPGQAELVSATDLRVLDVLGYHLTGAEPATPAPAVAQSGDLAVSQPYQLDAGQALWMDGGEPQWKIEATAPFTNDGLITFTATYPPSVYGLSGIDAHGTTVHNGATGQIYLEATPNTNNTITFGVRLTNATLTNDGLIQLVGEGAISTGIAGPNGGEAVVNSPTGVISVFGNGSAIGVSFASDSGSAGGSIDNQGLIKVVGGSDEGEAGAIGVWDPGTFTNSGVIDVRTNNPSADAVGVLQDAPPAGPNVLNNSGTIEAQTYALLVQYTTVNNSGKLIGAVAIGDGDNVLNNTGSIVGNVFLGDTNPATFNETNSHLSTYNGVGGTLVGALFLGVWPANATLGNDGETVFAGGMADTITGGAGDDFIGVRDGGAQYDSLVWYALPTNAIDGGGGYNTLSFASSPVGAYVDASTGTAFAAGHTTFSHIQRIVGSDFNNTLIAGPAGNELVGGAGDDILTGGAGADTLIASHRGSYMTGGGGADTFVYEAGDGQAIITDFGANGDADLLKVYGAAAASSVEQQGSNTLITLGAGDSILLENVQASSLTGANLEFSAAPMPRLDLPLSPGPPPKLPASEDFGGAGYSDLLFARPDGELAQWQIVGTTIAGGGDFGNAGGTWSPVGFGFFVGAEQLYGGPPQNTPNPRTGKADILFQDNAGDLADWLMSGTQIQGGGQIGNPGGSWQVKGVGDFNGDQFSDILFQDAGGAVATWDMAFTTIVGGGAIGNPGGTWRVAGVGDFNGDQMSDILFRDAGGSLAIWEMNDTRIIGGGQIGNPGGTWAVKGVGDFNGDGKADILFADAAGDYAIWDMNGTQIVGGGLVGNPGGSWSFVQLGDYNGDGKADILFQDAAGDLAVWEMNDTHIIGGGLIGNPGPDWHISPGVG